MFTSASHLDTFPLKLRGLQTRLQTRAVCITKISQQMPDQKVMEREREERERERDMPDLCRCNSLDALTDPSQC